jgi:hypothetical protein
MGDYDYTVAAHHESGHVVGACILSVPIRLVYITPGLSAYVPDLTFGEAAERGLIPGCAIVAALGPVVEQTLFGQYDPECCDRDLDMIEEGLLPRIAEEVERDRLREELPKMAREMVRRPGFLDAVRALAQELLKQPGMRKEMDGTKALAIVKESLNAAGNAKRG